MSDYRDACPECGQRDTAPSDGLVRDGMVSAQYQCAGCGYAWGCCWEIVPTWEFPSTLLVAPGPRVDHDRGWDYDAWKPHTWPVYRRTP